MKCPNCGSNLTIDDKVCSFCNEANPFAEEHRKEMQYFTSDYKRTKSQVLERTKTHSKVVAKITLVAVMIALNLLTWMAVVNSYDVERFILKHQISSDYQVHKREMERLQEERNFIGLGQYYTENRLGYSDLFDEYEKVYSVSSCYTILFEYVMELVMDEEDLYGSKETKVGYIADQIEYIYRYSKPSTYSNPAQYTSKHQEYMDAVVVQAEELIQTYLNIKKEDIEEFRSLSKARKQILIEEGLGINE